MLLNLIFVWSTLRNFTVRCVVTEMMYSTSVNRRTFPPPFPKRLAHAEGMPWAQPNFPEFVGTGFGE